MTPTRPLVEVGTPDIPAYRRNLCPLRPLCARVGAHLEYALAHCGLHLPSGQFASNSAWANCAAIMHNLLRAAGTVIGGRHAVARGATLRRHIVLVPARLARPQRRPILHLPEHWPWAEAWTQLWTAAHDPPTAA